MRYFRDARAIAHFLWGVAVDWLAINDPSEEVSIFSGGELGEQSFIVRNNRNGERYEVRVTKLPKRGE